MPETLRERGWDCAESVELNDWMDVFLHCNTSFDMGGSRESLEKLFSSVAEIRHTAVSRKRTDSEGIKKFLLNAEALSELLNVKGHLGVINKLRLDVKGALDDLDQNKQTLRSQLENKLLRIAAERAKLDRLESAAIAEMSEKDQEHQELIGVRLMEVIDGVEGTLKDAQMRSEDDLAD